MLSFNLMTICLIAFAEGISENLITKKLLDVPDKHWGNETEPIREKLITVKDYEECANKTWPKAVRDFVNEGADFGITLRRNIEAFSKFIIRPRRLRKVSNVKLSRTLFGTKVSFPLGISPTAFHQLYWPEGELATAKAAQDARVVMILSSYATSSIREIRKAAPFGTFWMMMHPYKDRTINEQIIKEAEKYQFQAIVITIDTPVMGRNLRNIKNGFKFTPDVRLPILAQAIGKPEADANEVMEKAVSQIDSDFTWRDINDIRAMTSLPIIAKGILTGADAYAAWYWGYDALIVSNNGGNQLDGGPATIDVLPEVVNIIRGSIDVYIDGGIRSGMDLFRAYVLGATACFLGRPVLWGLGCNGTDGVQSVIENYKDELNRTMKLAGSCSLEDLEVSQVVRDMYYNYGWNPLFKPRP